MTVSPHDGHFLFAFSREAGHNRENGTTVEGPR